MLRNGRYIKWAAVGTVLVVLFSAPALGAKKPRRRLRAFPGAEGFGAYTAEGRGGRIIEVTNLNTKGPGSLQWACNQKGPRIVVFRVSGIIPGPVAVREPFVTIAGQTAPGDGICIRGHLAVNTHNVILRHLRARPGDHPLGASPADRDGIGVHGSTAHDIIIDHCSVSWGIDENVSVYGPYDNITVQWCITSEAQWEAVMGTRPWSGKPAAKDDPKHPATYVNYIDCQEFIRRLNACGKRRYRLPTHCEWLYAARAGTDFALGFDPGKDILEYAWCSARVPTMGFFTSPQAVGLCKPNPWGLYDMGGNATEWVLDWYASDYYAPGSAKTHPMGPKEGTYRLHCGGHFGWLPPRILRYPQSNHRPHYRGPGVGFRLRRAVR